MKLNLKCHKLLRKTIKRSLKDEIRKIFYD